MGKLCVVPVTVVGPDDNEERDEHRRAEGEDVLAEERAERDDEWRERSF